MDTIKIEMDMPRPPEGWRHKGVCREPKNGEWFMDAQGHLIKATYDYVAAKHPILERVPWEPKPGDTVYQTNTAGEVWDSTFYPSPSAWLKFRVREDAQKFYTESRALADRIRAESEVQP
jgi:hypothetical protein